MEENMILNSIKVEISESEDKDYLEVKFILCDFNPNGNNVKLNRDTIETWLQTLVNKPIVGKIKNNNFTSHQYKNGKFGTDAFGVFTKAYIEKIDKEEYIIAEGVIWKRFEKACSIIESRMAKGLAITSSWEVSNRAFHMEDKVKVIDEGVFLGHCMLGNVAPAYECSKIVEVAELTEEEELEFSQAIESDLINIGGGKVTVENSQYGVNQMRKDIMNAIKALPEYANKKDVYVWFVDLFLDTNQVVFQVEKYEKGECISNFYLADYSLEEGGVSVSNIVEAEKTYVPKEQYDKEISALASSVANKESEIASLQKELEKIKTELSEKDGEIIKLGETINSQKEAISSKENLIAELEPVKIEMEKLKAEKEAQELAEKIAEKKAYVISTKYFSEEEIEASEEMKVAISELDDAKINSLIAKKVISEATKIKEENCENKDTKEKCEADKNNKEENESETSEKHGSHIDINLSSEEEKEIKKISLSDLLNKKRFK